MILNVKMLNGFSLAIGKTIFTESDINSKKICTLIQYLTLNRHFNTSQECLIEALWAGESLNPANALKNLVYRARVMLSAAFPEVETEFIKCTANNYVWTTDIETIIDCEQFELTLNAARDDIHTSAKKIELCKKALDDYTGEFLPSSSCERWVKTKSLYYKELYITAVNSVCSTLFETHSYDEAVKIYEKAIFIYKHEIKLHEYLIKAYSLAGKFDQAIAHYYCSVSIFQSELDAASKNHTSILSSEISDLINDTNQNLAAIYDELKEGDNPKQAFFCDYEVFKHIYHVNYRSAERSQKVVCLMLVSATDENGCLPNQDTLESDMETVMQNLRKILRKSDIFTRYSQSQYVILLILNNSSDAEIIAQRIKKIYSDGINASRTKINIIHKIV